MDNNNNIQIKKSNLIIDRPILNEDIIIKEENGEEKNNIKFPTYELNSLNLQLYEELNYETCMKDSEKILQRIGRLKNTYEHLFTNNKKLIDKTKNYKQSILEYFLDFNFLEREINIFLTLFEYKTRKKILLLNNYNDFISTLNKLYFEIYIDSFFNINQKNIKIYFKITMKMKLMNRNNM